MLFPISLERCGHLSFVCTLLSHGRRGLFVHSARSTCTSSMTNGGLHCGVGKTGVNSRLGGERENGGPHPEKTVAAG